MWFAWSGDGTLSASHLGLIRIVFLSTELPLRAVRISADWKKVTLRDLPGSPVVKTSSSNAGCMGSIPGQGAMIPLASQSKTPTHKTEAILQQTQ